MEREGLLISEKPGLDDKVATEYQRISQINDSIFESLYPPKEDRLRAKEDFLSSGRDSNPDLRPHAMVADDFLRQENELLAFKQDLKVSDLSSEIKQAYRWKVNESIAGIRMVLASIRGDMRAFNAYNKFVYGEPDKDIFTAAVDWVRHDLSAYLNSETDELRNAANDALSALPEQGGDRQLLAPDEEVFSEVRRLHFKEKGYFALLLSGVEAITDEGTIGKETGDPILQKVLHNLEVDYSIEDSVASTWSVNHKSSTVKRPPKYRLTKERFMGLPIGHEIGAHILEKQNGMRQPVRLFGEGLDRYELGNEGRGVVREQLPYEKFEDFTNTARWQDLLRRHIAISLATGMEGKGPQDFCSVFRVLNKLDYFWELRKGGSDPKKAKTKSESRTWATLERVFRGTQGEGGVYLKDKIYLEGNVACWHVAADNPEIIENGDLGKFDISNPRHIAFAQKVGVLPEPEH